MLYTDAEKKRRDQSVWTTVQAILAPLQFFVFLVSLILVINFFATGELAYWALLSVVIKTFLLFLIMFTGAIWEKEIFGCYLFAQPFFWEDVVSLVAVALHFLYLVVLFLPGFGVTDKLIIALVAYAVYFVNAIQFLLKLRAASAQSSEELREISV
ncbi:MAG: 2-vinyl bacteriochlorophyllide hydratase [Betaproteobacteria bacterium TMED82]|nr:MAG: 2-vinyl bacteriochlorophyllide hydratase [Betaproteobacteria bacterium TMED82]|tara:strand:- start:64732 stop:65199 length:468 start_codon:yes stop_codon:yes gene_type:complete